MNKSQKGPVFTEIVLEVFKLGGLLVNVGDRIGAEFGITSARWKILGAISLADKPLTVPQIARSMGLTRQAVQRLVDAMLEDGLLDFRPNPDHKRAKLITLSALGKETFFKLDEKQVRWANECSSRITQKDLVTTLDVLKRITDIVDR
jgi:DNA-binding MarR family transcriptional regulator